MPDSPATNAPAAVAEQPAPAIAEAPPVSAPTNATKVEAAIFRVQALCEAGKFIEARDAVRAAVRECVQEPNLERLRDVEVTVRRQAQEFMRLRADIEQLSSSDRAAQKVAAERMLCEEVGRIVLRQTVREGAAGPVRVAASSLAEIKDVPGVLAIARRAVSEPDAALAESLFLLLPDVASAVPLIEIPGLAGWAGSRTGAVADASSDLLRVSVGGELKPEALRTIADTALGPDSPDARGASELLAAVFGRVAKRDIKAFDALFGDGKGRHSELKAAIEAADSATGDLRAWAKRHRYAFLAVDRAQQAVGLAGHWEMEGVADERMADAGPRGRHATVRGVAAGMVVPGVIGKAIECGAESLSIEILPGETFSHLNATSFCYSAWVRRVKLPPTAKAENETVVIGREVPINRSLAGILMNGGGVVSFSQTVQIMQPGNEKDLRKTRHTVVSAVAKRPLDDGRWHHVAGVVLSRAGTIQLFIDGRLAAAENLPPGSVGLEMATPLRIGMGRTHDKDGQRRRCSNRFLGAIDDVRVYERALHESEIYGLYASGDM